MKVYAPPEDIAKLIESYPPQNEEFIARVRNYCRENGGGEHTGKIVRWPYGDGQAQYMVLEQGRTMCLIHLAIDDAWCMPEPFERGLRKKDVVEKIQSQERISALFSKAGG